jgi:hypothetical protein
MCTVVTVFAKEQDIAKLFAVIIFCAYGNNYLPRVLWAFGKI